MNAENPSKKKWTYLRDKMDRISDHAELVYFMVGLGFIVFVAFYSTNPLATIWNGVFALATGVS